MIVPGLVLTLVACLSSPLTNFELDSSPKETIVGHDFVSNTDIVREEGLTEYAIGSRILEPFFPEGGGMMTGSLLTMISILIFRTERFA